MKILFGVTTCHKFNYDMTVVDPCMTLYRQREQVKVGGQTVLTADYETPRVPVVRETWWNNVPASAGKFFFYGQPQDLKRTYCPQPDEIFLDVKDDYASLPYKTRALCRWALSKGYTHLCKADDDTYVYVDRILKSGFEKFPWIGRYNGGEFVAGGPAYWLDKQAMEVVASSGIDRDEWAEDIWVAKRLNAAGIHPHFDPRYVDLRRGMLSKDTVAVCECNPDVMRQLYKEESC